MYISILALPALTGIALFSMTSERIKLRDFLALRYPPRQWAHLLNSKIQVQHLGSKNVGNIHIGRDNWVFYITRTDGNAYIDFFGIPTPHIVEKWNQYLEPTIKKPYGFNAKFALVAPPNKETVFPDKTSYLFLAAIPKDRSNYSLLEREWKKKYADIYVPLLTSLRSANRKNITYFNADTHWNNWGAYVSHIEILNNINRQLNLDLTPLEAKNIRPGDAGKQDIVSMFNGVDASVGIKIIVEPEVQIEIESACCQTPLIQEDLYTVYSNPSALKVVWFIGDSFSDPLRPFFTSYFKHTIFMRYSAQLNKNIQRAVQDYGPPDMIIEEHVERMLSIVPAYVDYSTP